MKGKLIKTGNQYLLRSESGDVLGITGGSTDGSKLSLKNCQAIERGYDLDELAIECMKNTINQETGGDNHKLSLMLGFQKGFQDIREAFAVARHIGKNSIAYEFEEWFDRHMKQQTEWDVDIEMEYIGECNGNNDDGCFQDSPAHNCGCFERKPKLDQDGCLILKRI